MRFYSKLEVADSICDICPEVCDSSGISRSELIVSIGLSISDSDGSSILSNFHCIIDESLSSCLSSSGSAFLTERPSKQ